jgi:formylglycine-generating enzyme required for sulfatase activity
VLDSFFIGIFEVTQDIYQQIMPNNPSNWKGSQLPVEQVSWYEAVKFCNLLSRRDGLEEVYWIDGTRVIANFQKRGYRLPTEAEWEYAARGGNESKGYLYAGSNLVDYVAWYKTNSDGKSHVVGSKESNELGLFDMSGNVWEWCSDWYGQYSTSKKTNPIGPTTGLNKVLRGGGWIIDDERVRTTYRFYNDPSSRYSHYGFRVVVPAI